jgi:hypothetical protein
VAYPITFHVQIRDDVNAQETAHDLRSYFSRTDVVTALNDSGVVQFARLLLIPISRENAGIDGTFAIQVIIAYDGELDGVLRSFWDAPPLRSLFEVISSVALVPADSMADFTGFRTYIQNNNLNKKWRELRNAYRLTIGEIRQAFAHKPI